MVHKKNIWREMNCIQKQVYDLFSRFLSCSDKSEEETIDKLHADYRTNFKNYKGIDKEFAVQLELPGMEKKEINHNVIEAGFEIKAEKKQEKSNEKQEEYNYTKSYAESYRAFNVMDNTNLENRDVSYIDRILRNKLSKNIRHQKNYSN